MSARRDDYLPALKFDRLTRFYDPAIRLTTRERKFKDRLLDQAGVQGGERVLDLGCGTGTLAIAAKQRTPGAEVTGLDGDPKILARARRKVAADRVAVNFDQGYSDQLPYADSAFDVVLSTLFFHHIDRATKERTATEIARVLRPGGRLHIADWGPPSDPLMKLLSLTVRFGDGPATTRDNLSGALPQILAAAGLTDVGEHGSMRTFFGSLVFYSGHRRDETEL